MVQPANLILFLSESHAPRLLGAAGHRVVRTPNLDRLAARGVIFENAYCSSPLCVPARASLATGRYPHETGYWDNANAYDGRVASWMRRLREQGHTAVSVGKLHFRGSDDDNGFSEEIDPMHIVGGAGDLTGLLRCDGLEPVRRGVYEMYTERSHAGNTSYQDYDRRITARAVRWLREVAPALDEPWVLSVHYVSAHPPFTVPERLLALYPEADMPLPPAFRSGERPEHPAIRHLRRIRGHALDIDPATLRRVQACYFALLTHLDEQVGEVLAVADSLGLLPGTRVLYTADHGESAGSHFIMGKSNLYQHSVGVPLILAGPEVSAGRRVRQIVSHVDLFKTLVEGAGATLMPEDRRSYGVSLWPAIQGHEQERLGFAEYHALGSAAASYMVRVGQMKLIHHVGMPAQLFDLATDPDEVRDLAADPAQAGILAALEARLRQILDPAATDARAKADQRRAVAAHGGVEAILARGSFPFTPAPGTAAEFHPGAPTAG